MGAGLAVVVFPALLLILKLILYKQSLDVKVLQCKTTEGLINEENVSESDLEDGSVIGLADPNPNPSSRRLHSHSNRTSILKGMTCW